MISGGILQTQQLLALFGFVIGDAVFYGGRINRFFITVQQRIHIKNGSCSIFFQKAIQLWEMKNEVV